MDEEILARMKDGEMRDRIPDEFNRSTLDDVGPVGGEEQGMSVLQEMNELEEGHEEFVESLVPTVGTL